MKKYLLIISLLLLFGFSANSQSTQRPNVLLIYSDDQGSIDLNCYGATDLYTPHLDRLASDGVRFTQFYAGSSVCSPSRASLLTGMSPQAAGLPGNTSSQEGRPGMPGNRVTIAEVLQGVGYATAHIGKWHLGYSDDTEPLAQGFDYSFGHMGGCIDNYSHFFYWNGPNKHDLWENNVEIYRDGDYFPDMMVEKATGFFEEHQKEPFFMYFAINLPHYPLQPSPKWREHYKDLEMPRRDYAAFISTIDERVGQLISSLEELGLRENTIIIFQSDQGHSCETRTFNGGGNAGEFRGAKASLFEGGIRVPAIINWPSHLPQGQTNNTASINYDWLPTIAELCGVKSIPAEVEGKSLLPIIDNPGDSRHDSFRWKLGRQWAVRQGPWKLLGNPTDPSGKYPIRGESDLMFLVNLDEDVSEKKNLAETYPDKVKELTELYLSWEFGNESDIPSKEAPLKNLALGSKITGSKPNQAFTKQGLSVLINNKRGTANIRDGEWVGIEKSDFSAEITLNKPTEVKTISVRCLQDLGSWIFLPTEIELRVITETGKEVFLGKLRRPSNYQKTEYKVHTFKFKTDQTIRSLKVSATNQGQCPDWHPGKGGNAWLFIDEVIVE